MYIVISLNNWPTVHTLLTVSLPLGIHTVTVLRRGWPANTGPNTCYGDFGPINLAVL